MRGQEGGRGRGADTKPKTKTPHVNVGNNKQYVALLPSTRAQKFANALNTPKKRIKSHLPGGALGAGRAAAECSLHHLDK